MDRDVFHDTEIRFKYIYFEAEICFFQITIIELMLAFESM
jgi:hypothetical protein